VGTAVRFLAKIEHLRGRAGDGEISRSFEVGGFMVSWSYSPKDESWWAYWGRRRKNRSPRS
jgi:hypothetical protein